MSFMPKIKTEAGFALLLGLLLGLGLLAVTLWKNHLDQDYYFQTSQILKAELPQIQKNFSAVVSTANINAFYKFNHYHLLWSDALGLRPSARELINTIENALAFGLMPESYHYSRIKKIYSPHDIDYLNAVQLDWLLTDAYLKFAAHLEFSKLNPQNDQIRSTLPTANQKILFKHLIWAAQKNKILESLEMLEPQNELYVQLKKAYQHYLGLYQKRVWRPISEDLILENPPSRRALQQLRKRLVELGDLPDLMGPFLPDGELDDGLIRFKKRNGLEANAVLDFQTLIELNQSLESRIRQMQINLDRMRQLSPKNDKRYLFINIASFEVVVMEYDQKKLIIPAIVGKLFRKTPSFRSELNQIVINPTWKVPHRIAAEDLLPIIQEDPDYLVRQNYQVFNSWSDKAKPLNIQKIEWKKLDKEHFPYRIAQKPGPQNLLGKFIFLLPNNYDIYLHDTPSSNFALFKERIRTFSSGCIRLEKPKALAKYFLGPMGWSSEKIDRVIESQKETAINLYRPFPVYVVYLTSWQDADGGVQFREDIYGNDLDYERIFFSDVFSRAPSLNAGDRMQNK
jgi:murein L,D-transpeptidase YcbB/YkuD